MDDRKLEVLIAAVDEGSFSKAARKCYCTQSAVTQLVNAIEDELGLRILERTYAGVALTAEGEALMPFVRRAHEALGELRAAAEDAVGSQTEIRIGAYPGIARTMLPKAMASFQEREPDTSFEIVIGSNNLANMLRSGEIDIALCDDWLFEAEFASNTYDYREEGSRNSASFAWMPLAEEPLLAIVPAGMGYKDSQTIERKVLFSNPYIFNPNNVFAWYLANDLSSLIKVGSDDDASTVSMVASGMGVAVLPASSLDNVPEGISVLAINPPGKRMLGVALPPRVSSVARRFALFLSENASVS